MSVEKALNKALNYLSKSPKTVRQMEKYLLDKGYDTDTTDQVVVKLLKLNYLDDKAFAQLFIESRIRSKPKSVFALGVELRQKGIDPALSEELLTVYDDFNLALKAVETKTRAWRQLDESKCKNKMMNFLRYRGFDYNVCHQVWQVFQKQLHT